MEPCEGCRTCVHELWERLRALPPGCLLSRYMNGWYVSYVTEWAVVESLEEAINWLYRVSGAGESA